MNFLDFEKDIANLEAKIDALRCMGEEKDIDIAEDIRRLEVKSMQRTRSIYASLSPWQIAQVARHPDRPHALDYIDRMITDFDELHGDRHIADDPALVCGLGRLQGMPVAIVGHQKGRTTRQRLHRNYGMPKPEGYRKALRIMRLAERFHLPVISLVDTPGAYPGIDAEERGQSVAIAENLMAMSCLKIPVIAVVIGEGGSGGALAIGVADRLYMLRYSVYSVISPEGCASILWKDSRKAEQAAEVMGITAQRLQELKLIDGIVEEPVGGAHRDYDAITSEIKGVLAKALEELSGIDSEALVHTRQEKIRNIGIFG